MRFHAPTRIVFGSGKITRLKELVGEELRASRPFLITDRGIRRAGIADRVTSLFPGIPVFDEVEQNPRHDTVNRAGERARELQPDLIIGLGGGSAIDAAKAVALLAANPGGIEDYEGREKYLFPPLPVVAVPTTCGTGSEVTWVSVITHTGRRFKMSIKGSRLFPVLALVDPDLLCTLPPALVAATGMDALTHAVEAYTVKPATPVTDLFALEALKRIIASLEEAFQDIKSNRRARESLMLGSTLAGLAFGNSDVGAVHCLAEAVGSVYDTPHGVANALFLPYVMEFNLPACAARYAEIARAAGIEETEEEAAARKLVAGIKDLSWRLGIPTIRDIGLTESGFQEIAEKSFANNSNPSNPREASVEDYLSILSRALAEAGA